jgi:hypothetical protein
MSLHSQPLNRKYKADLSCNFKYVHCKVPVLDSFISAFNHRFNMELDLQSLFGLHLYLYSLAESPQLPLPPHLGSYTRALLVSQDRRHLFVTPCLQMTTLCHLFSQLSKASVPYSTSAKSFHDNCQAAVAVRLF